jgi:hypothetical protein
MTRALAVAMAAFLAVAALPADEKPVDKDKDEKGWVKLFNGKDFTGWKMPNPPSGEFKGVTMKKNDDGKVIAFVGETKKGKEITLWQIKEGNIVGGGPASHIFSERGDYKDFHYKVEAKINDKGNSGQYFRTRFEAGFPLGWEAQINATHGDRVKTGSLYPDYRQKDLKDIKELIVLKAAHKPDEWFTQEVICKGDHFVIKVNGKTTVDWKDPKGRFKQGHFALQGHDPGSVMQFRKVEVKELTEEKK